MKKFLILTSLIAVLLLTALPVLALETGINYGDPIDSGQSDSVKAPADVNVNYGNYIGLGDPKDYTPGISPWFGVALAFMVAMLVLVVIVVIFLCIDVYHWGMTDKAAFEKAGVDKKRWYLILFILPLITGAVQFIPIIGQILGVISSIFYTIMVLIYFFSVRKKVV